jgi:DNA replication protein DnaC
MKSFAYQMKAACFPARRDLAGLDFAASWVDQTLVCQLHEGVFTNSPRNVVLIGGAGTGRGHLATALGIAEPQRHGRRVGFFSSVDLVDTLEHEKNAGKQGKLAYRLGHVDAVILDELDYLPFSRVAGA